jgi:hypothetical protein
MTSCAKASHDTGNDAGRVFDFIRRIIDPQAEADR